MRIFSLVNLYTVILITVINSYASGQYLKNSNYEWLSNARIFIVDGYYYPLCPSLEFNAGKMAETMADMHANVLRIATSGHCGWMIPGTKFVSSLELGTRDILDESIKACKPLGIRVVPYINTGHTQKTSHINPEWAQKLSPEGNYPSYWNMDQMVTPICFNSSYREAFYDLIKTVVSKYDIDGIYFDTWVPFYFFNGSEKICYCDGCVNGFRKATGLEIPYKDNTREYSTGETKILNMYRDWCKEELYSVFSETKRIIKSYKDIPLIYNIGNPPTIMGSDFRILDGSDAFLYERGRSLIERAEGISLAINHGLAVWPYVGTYDPYPRIPHFSYELGQEIYTSVSFGGSPALYHTYFYTDHPECRAIIKEAFTTFDKNEKFVKGFESDKFCAVIWNNVDPPDHAIDSWLWDTNARLSSLGSFSALIRNHVQVTSMLKQDLDNKDLLNRFKVLFLPDICYLSENQITNITNFVKNGGGLVMTYSTSLYDDKGQKRQDFALGSLAGIKYIIPDSATSETIARRSFFGSASDIYFQGRPGQEIVQTNKLFPAHNFETVDVLPGAQVIADLVQGKGSAAIVPGLVISKFGKGRVAYIAAATGAMFQQTGIMEFSDFLMDVVKYVSPGGIPYEIDAPRSTLFTNMTVKGNFRVFHLISWLGSQNEDMWQNVYYIPKIENISIKLKIPDGKKIKTVTPFIPVNLKTKLVKDILLITIPYVDRYQGIAVELE